MYKFTFGLIIPSRKRFSNLKNGFAAPNEVDDQKAKILVVEKDMDMKKIMTDLELNSIWVGVYKSLTMDVFVDDQERSLVTSTDNDTIDHSGLNAFSFAETQAVVLKKVNG